MLRRDDLEESLIRADLGVPMTTRIIKELQPQGEKLTAESVVSAAKVSRPEPSQSPSWEKVAALFRDPVSPEMVGPYQFCFDSPLVAGSPTPGWLSPSHRRRSTGSNRCR